jgi:SRSO17 transposase
MDARQIERLRPMLNAFLGQFDSCFGRREPVEHLKTYVLGQLSALPRKSMEPMADAAGKAPRNLQNFLSLHEWDDLRVRDLLQQKVARDRAQGLTIGVIDETAHVKKGGKTPGVQRQWCGRLGKVENCVVTVHLAYVAGDFHCLIDGELFLPEDWSADRERCRAAGIPDGLVHRPKWRIALQERDRAVANGIHFDYVTFDENYPMNPEFLFALDDRGQHYVGEVKRTYSGWLAQPALLYKRPAGFKGRTGRFPRLKNKSSRPVSLENMLAYSPILRKAPWEKFHIKDTDKGPMVWQAKAAAIYLRRQGLPTRPHWLVIARNVARLDEVKFFIGNAPAGTPLEVLLHVGFSRAHVERCFEDEKSELGLSHFELRNYRGLRRHLTVTALTHLFLAEVHHQWRGEKSGVDGLPASSRQFRVDPLSMGVRARSQEIPGNSGLRPSADTGSQSPSAALPWEGPTQAVTQARHQTV